VQEKVRAAQDPQPAEFPQPAGKTLQALADEIGGGPEMGLAGSVFLAGQENRVAFGVIDETAGFLYGKTALYVARTPGSPAKGPYVAPADVLVTEAPYRSEQAATEADPFAAVYAAKVPFAKPGKYAVMAVTLVGGKPVAAPGELQVTTSARSEIPEIGEPAPRVETDTVASAGGDVEAIDTRRPTSDMPNKGVRKPLQDFRLQTEPWLFVVGKDGKVTARLEGSFGLAAVEQALKTAL
jgi:hypothetical protein